MSSNGNLMAKVLFYKLLSEGSITSLAELKSDFFDAERPDNDIISERDLFTYISNHYNSYENLPDFFILKNSGVDLEKDVLSVPVIHPLEYYVTYFKDRYFKSKIEKVTKDLGALRRSSALDTKIDQYEGILAQLQEAIQQGKKEDGLTTLKEGVEKYLENYDKSRGNSIAGVSTGFAGLDSVTDGIKAGDIFVIAARPNVGKTYILLKMALESWLAGKTVLVVSLEMEMTQIVNRCIAMYARLKPDLVAQNRLTYYGEQVLVQKSHELMSRDNFHLLEGNLRKSVNDVLDVVNKINPDVIFIDGVYLLEPISVKKKYDNRREKISDVLESIKSVAMETGKGFVVTTQFNRQVKKKTKSELDLSNIAETDVIGQLASVVMGVKMGVPPYADNRRIIEVIKNRNGPLTKFEMNYDFKSMDFDYIGIYDEDSAINKIKDRAQQEQSEQDVSWMY